VKAYPNAQVTSRQTHKKDVNYKHIPQCQCLHIPDMSISILLY